MLLAGDHITPSERAKLFHSYSAIEEEMENEPSLHVWLLIGNVNEPVSLFLVELISRLLGPEGDRLKIRNVRLDETLGCRPRKEAPECRKPSVCSRRFTALREVTAIMMHPRSVSWSPVEWPGMPPAQPCDRIEHVDAVVANGAGARSLGQQVLNELPHEILCRIVPLVLHAIGI